MNSTGGWRVKEAADDSIFFSQLFNTWRADQIYRRFCCSCFPVNVKQGNNEFEMIIELARYFVIQILCLFSNFHSLLQSMT